MATQAQHMQVSSVAITQNGNVTDFKAHFPSHVPSWELPGRSRRDRCYAEINAKGHMDAGWVTFVTEEAGEKTRRATMLTVHASVARELALWILAVTNKSATGQQGAVVPHESRRFK